MNKQFNKNRVGWDINKLKPGESLRFEDGSRAYKTAKGNTILTPARKYLENSEERMKSFGNRFAGGTLRESKTGKEVQAGIGDLHVGAGYDTKRRSAGFDVSRGKKRFEGSVNY